MEIRRRLPAIERKVSSINPEKDVRIRLVGTVIDVNDNMIVLDDGTGKVEISFNENVSYINQGQLIRVITRVLPLVEGFDCKGECIQSLNDFNLNLYNRVKEVINR